MDGEEMRWRWKLIYTETGRDWYRKEERKSEIRRKKKRQRTKE